MEDEKIKNGIKEIQNIKMSALDKENMLKSILNNTVHNTKTIKSSYSFVSLFRSPVFYYAAAFCLIIVLGGGFNYLNQGNKNTNGNLATTQGTIKTNNLEQPTTKSITENTNRQIAKSITKPSGKIDSNTPSTLSMPIPATMMAPTTSIQTKINMGLEKAFELYQNGQISECNEKGEIYYSASLNAYDGEGKTFDINGKVVGEYQGFTGSYTGIHPENCELIYVIYPNIWGLKALNKYNLK